MVGDKIRGYWKLVRQYEVDEAIIISNPRTGKQQKNKSDKNKRIKNKVYKIQLLLKKIDLKKGKDGSIKSLEKRKRKQIIQTRSKNLRGREVKPKNPRAQDS